MTRARVAGIVAEVAASESNPVVDRLRGLPAGDGDPDLVVELVADPRFSAPPAANPPAFDARAAGDDALELWRADVVGRVEVPADPAAPVRARFTHARPLGAEAGWRVALATALVRRGGFALHASAVERDGRAYVFSGHSGAGKSTIARLLSRPGSGRTRLADELLVVRRAAGGWLVELPPFFTPEPDLPFGRVVPLASYHSLAHAPRDERTALPPAAALPRLMENVLIYSALPRIAAAVLDVGARFAAEVPCYRLRFRPHEAVAAALGW
ncbi:MAG: hypothetical protein D6689_21635 [Deltaproteobacteria bacterium]|nr:MAG: hypothetical protein D6689_21635 [Deltaproteobacteria bacterium]